MKLLKLFIDRLDLFFIRIQLFTFTHCDKSCTDNEGKVSDKTDEDHNYEYEHELKSHTHTISRVENFIVSQHSHRY